MNTSHTEIFISTDIDNPMVPKNLTIQSFPYSDSIRLDWDPNTDDTVKYEIFIIDPANGKWRYHRNITHPVSYYTENNEGLLLNNFTHSFKVRAWDDAGHHSEFTEVVSVFHVDNETPVSPTGLIAETVSETEIRLTWVTANSRDIIAAGIYINNPTNTSGGPYHKIGEVPMPLYTTIVTGLNENTTYYFVVTGIDKANLSSPFSNEANATTLNIPPGAPTLDSIPTLTNNSKLILTGAGEYNATIKIFNNDMLIASTIANLTDQFTIEVNLEEGLNMFKAIAFDQANNSGNFSNTVSITLDTTPPELTLSKFIAYTNDQQFIVSGTTENDLEVFFYNNDILVYTGYANAQGIFKMEITLVNGTNSIDARAMDIAGNLGNRSTAQVVILDQEPPIAAAGPDENILLGNSTTFNGSSSTDNWGIDNYTWTFDYDGNSIVLYGPIATYEFNIDDVYYVTLTVEDLAGNTDTDVMWITVDVEKEFDSEPPEANAGKNFEIATGTEITFNGTGSSDNFGISKYTWTFTYDGETVELNGSNPSFKFDIAGNYTVTLTVFDYADPANSDIDIIYVKVTDKSELDSDGDGIDDQWEDDNGLDKYDSSDAELDYDNDNLTNLKEYQYGTNPLDHDSDNDGLPDGWEIANNLDPLDNGSTDIKNGPDGDPDGDGYTNLEELESGTDPQDSESQPKETDDDDEDYMMYIMIMIVVIVILIALLAMALRKPGPSEEEILAAEEDEDIGEEKSPLDMDTFDCPTCGAELTDEVNTCPECGEEFGDEE
jgi:PKD repeat protein